MYDLSKLYYEIHGTGKRSQKKNVQTLVFLHGVNGNLTTWKYFVDRFKKSYRILLVDLRGHGKSPYGGTRLKDFVEDIHYIFQKEKIKNAILVGNSFGAIIALEYYKKYPQKVSQLQLMNVSGFNTLQFPMTTLFVNMLIGILAFILTLFRLDKLTSSDTDFSNFYKEGFSSAERLKICFTTNANLYAKLSRKTVYYNYSFDSVAIPVVLLSPQFDVLVSVRKLVKLVNSPLVTLAIVKGADHLMITKNPQAVYKTMNQML